MNNVQNGVWHGRNDTICLVSSGGEGSKAFAALSSPPLFTTKSPAHFTMEKASTGSQHSWDTGTRQSEGLVLHDQFEQGG